MAEVATTFQVINNSFWWITPLAIVISASIGAIFAHLSIKHQREVARMKATLDIILESESNKYYQEIYACYASEVNRNGGLVSLASPSSASEKDSQRKLDDFLNHYELVAIAIKKKILDEHFYKTWMRSTYIKHFEACHEYILEIRKQDEADARDVGDLQYKSKAFIEFEAAANKWKSANCKC